MEGSPILSIPKAVTDPVVLKERKAFLDQLESFRTTYGFKKDVAYLCTACLTKLQLTDAMLYYGVYIEKGNPCFLCMNSLV
jgi:hypothetical protein